MARRMTRAEFIEKAEKAHQGRYDYSKVEYKNGTTKVVIICKTHGEFTQKPYMHLQGQGCPECAKAARKNTCKARYGLEMPMMSDEAREKTRQTNLARYGGENVMASQAVRDKIKSTWLEKYGTDNPQKVPEIREKTAATNLVRYGAASSFQNPDVQARHRETMMARYGVPNSLQVPAFRQKAVATWQAKYGVDNPRKASVVDRKSRQTCLVKYGVEYPVLDEGVKLKGLVTKRRRHTFNTSKPEEALYVKLVERFGQDDVMRQYRDDPRYPFCCDFYVKSRDMFIELNASWTHGGYWFDGVDPADAARLKSWMAQGATKQYYVSAAQTWGGSDVRKRGAARDGSLNYVVFWDLKLRDADIWLALGCPDGRDWDRPWSWYSD